MAVLKQTCPYCKKTAIEQSFSTMGKYRIVKLDCGHTVTHDQIKELEKYEVTSQDGKFKLYPFQQETVKFIEKANGRCLIAHEMGLGKTVIDFAFLKLHPEALPAVFICKGALVRQIFLECFRWTGMPAQMITTGRETPDPSVFKVFIISYDLVKKHLDDLVNEVKPKTVFIDECQQIKNGQAKRTNAVRELIKHSEAPNIIATSGTPIKNHAAEFFPILNILQPNRFYSYAGFCQDWLDTFYDRDGKRRLGGIKSWRQDQWKKWTSDFMTRKTRAEAMPEIPKVRRNFRFNDLGSEVEDAYRKQMEGFLEAYESGKPAQQKSVEILGFMARMRHITGIAKIDYAVDFTDEFLASHADDETNGKLVLFVHHKVVAENLKAKLGVLCKEYGYNEPLTIASGDDATKVVDKFRLNKLNKVLIASTLVAGEGLNLQFCHTAVIVERQWNPANEEQAEARFTRIGSEADYVDITYLVAVGTIDEFFATLVEQKRSAMASTLDGQQVKWEESSLMQELADVLATTGRKRWRL